MTSASLRVALDFSIPAKRTAVSSYGVENASVRPHACGQMPTSMPRSLSVNPLGNSCHPSRTATVALAREPASDTQPGMRVPSPNGRPSRSTV